MKRPPFVYIVVILMIAAFFWRLFLVFDTFDEASGCGSCLAIASAISDAPFLVLWAAIMWFGFTTRFTFISRLARLVSVASLILYIADIYVMGSFYTRLYVTWVVSIGATPGVVVDYLKASGILELIALFLLLGLLTFSLIYKPGSNRISRKVFLLFAGLLVVSSIASRLNQTQYVHAWATDNVFLTSQFSGISKPYSDGYLEGLGEKFTQIPDCREGLDSNRDVIVLILESWSAYQSKAWGGVLDWTPELDRISRNSLLFQRAIAGGFDTNQGLMSIISGIPVLAPLTSLFTRKTFEPAWGWDFTLPKQLGAGGYNTAFLTSGHLGFQRKADWIAHTGFDYIEGHDASIYDGHPRGQFDAAPDEVLFRRAAEYWEENSGSNAPQAIVVESVSSHTPFVHPLTGEKSEESVIRYMDTAAADFFHSLKSRGYFSQGGILVTVSDHRSMTVLRDDEKRLFGELAPARIPLLVYGEGFNGRAVEKVVHQSDITPSLSGLLTNTGCGFSNWRNLFDENIGEKNQCAFHASGTDWENVLVFCDSGFGVIKLQGDHSQFIEAHNISSSDQIRLLEKVALFRSVAHKNYTRFLSSQ